MSEDFPENPTLLIEGGPIDGHSVAISPGTTIVIGSGRLAHLRLDHPDIEMAHVKVAWDDQGISMIDNGSRKGTWVNGELVETTALIDGDVIQFVAPGSKTTPPRVRIRIPKGAVPEPPPLPTPPEPAPGAGRTAPPTAAKGRVGARGRARKGARSGPRLPSIDLRAVGILAGGVLVLVALAWLVLKLFFSAPIVYSVLPAQAEPGHTVSVSGRRFAGEASGNTVWFGDRSVPAASAAGERLTVTVPPARPGPLEIRVETSRGRSRAVAFVLLPSLRAVSLDPAGALPGDEVAVAGKGFDSGVATVSVGGKPATVLAADAAGVRFTVPALEGAPGSAQPVVVTVGGRSTAPLSLALGRLPLVLSFEPPRAVAGEVVRIRGIGFAAQPGGNAVTFDAQPALVLAATPVELTVLAPVPARAQAETLAQVVVRAGGRTSSGGATFPLLRLVDGSWVLRFLPEAVEGGTDGEAFVATEIAPVVLLAGPDHARSVVERAQRVAAILNAAVDAARTGTSVTFEARETPDIGVGLAGQPDLILSATPHDAAAYDAPPGLPPRSAPPTPAALARFWAALLNDYVTIGTGSSRPSQAAGLSPTAGSALAQLRTALPWQYGVGVANARVITLSGDLRRRLREAALKLP